MGERLATWDERKAMKIAYLEQRLRRNTRVAGKRNDKGRYDLEYKRFIVEMMDVYESHSLPVYASFQAVTGLTYATLRRWRKTVHAYRGQYVPDEVRLALDYEFNYVKEDTDE